MADHLEKTYTLFTIDDSFLLHTNCVLETCVSLGGDICITKELCEYLKTQQRVQEKYPFLIGDDWNNLVNNNPKARSFLSSSRAYRLRFKTHAKEGIKFVDKMLRGYQEAFAAKGIMNLWGSPLEIVNMAGRFQLLCAKAQYESTGAIYRLYDLCEGKMVEATPFSITKLLCILFAMGQGKSSPVKVEFIAQFVSGYQFFLAFCNSKKQYFRDLIEKKTRKDDVSIEAAEATEKYLMSQEGYDEAIKLWMEYMQAYKSAFGSITASIKAVSDLEFVQKLRALLPRTPIRPGGNNKFPINFYSDMEAIYHAFKHEDVTQSFHSLKQMTPNESMFNYLEVIRYVIQAGNLVTSIPDQFVKGRNYTFELKTPSGLNVRVFIRRFDGHNTYTLSCF
ncbi:MAG: hypothetical protein LLG04_09170 [Parachlamydia sp.]|nr:hypothetical protein [Parachlamydia sp.]